MTLDVPGSADRLRKPRNFLLAVVSWPEVKTIRSAT